jgi:hypothetical protein
MESHVKRISPAAFSRARNFLKTKARPLDRALFEHRFEGSSPQKAITALSTYQNDDGGFGRALEADLRTPTSSALATGHGLSLLKELGCPRSHPAVSGALGYLLDTFDQEAHAWRVVPLDANEYAHAPWWHDDGTSLARTFDNFVVIPRALILGLLWHYSAGEPEILSGDDWLEEITGRTVADIESLRDLGSGGGDDLVYALSLLETEELPEQYRIRLAARLGEVVPRVVDRNPKEWNSYCITPLKLAPSPKSFAAGMIEDDIQAHLDYQIEHQSPEGTWDPVWTWGDFYPGIWPQACKEWRGHLTLETLTSLCTFGRIQQ